MTEKSRRVYEFAKNYQAENGKFPTVNTIAEGLDLSLNAINNQLINLVQEGLVRKIRHKGHELVDQTQRMLMIPQDQLRAILKPLNDLAGDYEFRRVE